MSEHNHKVKTKHLSKSAQMAADIASGKVKYLHVSVQVAKQAVTGIPMRTPKGKGATAQKAPMPVIRVGAARRHAQRLMRAAEMELNRADL